LIGEIEKQLRLIVDNQTSESVRSSRLRNLLDNYFKISRLNGSVNDFF
jgi:hypothetical protein